MSDSISRRNQNTNTSPFEAIRHTDGNGQEYWSARELMIELGYAKWQRFEDAIERAKISCEVAQGVPSDHFTGAGKVIITGKGAHQELADYHLTRYACYLVAMNGDPRKTEIANAQRYFAQKTREAELAPASRGEVANFLNTLWIQRLRLFGRHTKIPVDKFCIYIEISTPFYQAEICGYKLPDKAVPDGSVGSHWCKYARNVLHLNMQEIEKYPHHYPDKRGAQMANIYPIEWIGPFRKWFYQIYIPEHLPEYLRYIKASPEEIVQVLIGLGVDVPLSISSPKQRRIRS